MLRTQGLLQQRSFFDSLIEDALKANQLLSTVDSVLNNLPHLLDPFVAAYGHDRMTRGIDGSFGRPTIPVESIVRLILLKHLHKNCALRDVEQRTKTDYAWKGFAKLSLILTGNENTPFGRLLYPPIDRNLLKALKKKKLLKSQVRWMRLNKEDYNKLILKLKDINGKDEAFWRIEKDWNPF